MDATRVDAYPAGTAEPELVRGSREACRALDRFARAYPVGVPRSLWAAGWFAHLDGRTRRAPASWRRSLEVAERLRMPYDQARAHVALADTAEDDAVAADHRARAKALLDDMGARPALLGLRPETVALTLD
jgi:eukaryotic-like serine/threonine-protein kinase